MDFSNTNRDTTLNLVNVCLNLAITWGAIKYGIGELADIFLPILFLILASRNKVSFSSGVFFNKKGNELTQILPKKFSAWITLSVILVTVGMYIDLVPVGRGLFASFITVLSSYFMFNQCPISIINSRDAWKHKKIVFGMVPNPQIDMPKRRSTDFITDPAYSQMPGNMWYRSRHRSKH